MRTERLSHDHNGRTDREIRRYLSRLLGAAYALGAVLTALVNAAIGSPSLVTDLLLMLTLVLFAVALQTRRRLWALSLSELTRARPRDLRRCEHDSGRVRLWMFTPDGIRAHPAYSLTMMVSLYFLATTVVTLMTGSIGTADTFRTAATQFSIGTVSFAIHLSTRLGKKSLETKMES